MGISKATEGIDIPIVEERDQAMGNKKRLPLGTINYSFVSNKIEVHHQLVFYRHLYGSKFHGKKGIGFAALPIRFVSRSSWSRLTMCSLRNTLSLSH